jgi:hypothetical protein
MERLERLFDVRPGVTVVLIAALVFGGSAAQAAMPSGCAMPGTRVLADAPLDGSGSTSSLISIDPVDGRADRLPISNPRSVTMAVQPGFVIVDDAVGRHHLVRLRDGRTAPVPGVVVMAAETVRSFGELFHPARWDVLRTYDEVGLRLRIVDRDRTQVVFDAMFPRRIEIAATAVSPSGRFVVHVQANNVASELTLFDAGNASRRDLRIPHDAPLAAYAMTLTFSPDGACLAISMAREDQLSESWLIDLRQPKLAARPIGDVFVLAWVVVSRSESASTSLSCLVRLLPPIVSRRGTLLIAAGGAGSGLGKWHRGDRSPAKCMGGHRGQNDADGDRDSNRLDAKDVGCDAGDHGWNE